MLKNRNNNSMGGAYSKGIRIGCNKVDKLITMNVSDINHHHAKMY